MNKPTMPSPQDREAALFALAIEKPAAERAGFLDAVCGADKSLRRRLEALLAAHEQPDGVLPTQAETVRLDRELEFADEPPDEAVGQTIGRYKLLEKIGEGGCGVVYVAEQIEPVLRRVALKVIKLGMDTKQVVARFEAERQALAMMDHPNIAKVLDAGTTEDPLTRPPGTLSPSGGEGRGEGVLSAGRPYFVMELVRGIRITDYCDQTNLSTKERLDLFIQVCKAIQHAHQKGIIHRDIKPSNILVTLHDGEPVPKVIDFGIAKATEGRLTDATVYTQLHQFIGTPAYMSPEQAEMSGLDIDTRSDIYSLGVLLYELLAGSTPFDAKELMASGIDAMRKTIREKEPERPSTRLATLKGEELTTTAKRRSTEAPRLIHLLKGDLDWIVMKCLEKDRARRYETANGLAADLKRHLNHEPVVARPQSTAYRFQKAFRRNKLAFIAAGAVAAALVVGIGVSTWQMFAARKAQRGEEIQRQEAQRKQAEAEAERLRAESEQQRADFQARKASESQQLSRRLLYASDMNLAQQSLRQNNLGRARRLLDRHRPQPGEEDLRGWEWRYLWQLTRSSALVTLTNRPARGFRVSFSPDGRRLAVGWYDGRVDLWDVPGRRLFRPLTDREQPHKGQVAFSPLRNLLLATSEPKTVTLYDLDSGLESVLWRAPEREEWEVRDLAFSQDGSKATIYAGSIREVGDAVWVVDVASARIESRHSTLASDSVHCGAARLSPDNRRLYLSRSRNLGYQCSIQCIDLTTGTQLWETEQQREFGLTTLAISPDGKVLAAGSGFLDPTIRLWDAATGQLRGRFEGHTGWVAKLVFSKDGKQLLSAGSDQTIRFWETGNWTATGVLRGHTDEINSVTISESAQLIASTGKDGNLMLWRADGTGVADGYRLLPPGLDKHGVMPLDHGRLLLLPSDRSPELLDLKHDVPSTPLNEMGRDFLDWLPGGILCHWTGTNQILVREWRGGEFVRLGAIKVDSGQRPTGVAYNLSRHLLAWTEETSPTSVFLVGLGTPGRLFELRSDVRGLVPFRFSEDGSHLVAGRKKWFSQRLDPVRGWNIESGQIVVSIDEPILAATTAAGGRVLVATIPKANDHEIAFYDLAHPGPAPRRVPGRNSSTLLAVSPDGQLVASTTGGGLVRLFDPVKGEIVANLQGHLNAAFGAAFSPDGRRLISSYGGREAIKLWDVGTRQELLTLNSSTGEQLHGAIWSSDGDVILAEAPWQAWRAPSWEEIAAAEAKEKAEIKQP